jgi:ADP-ribose pyrophosphatase YjhB (NUDIX family)
MLCTSVQRACATTSRAFGSRVLSTSQLGAALAPAKFGALSLEWAHLPIEFSKSPQKVFATALEEAASSSNAALWCTLRLSNGPAVSAAIAAGLKAHHTTSDGESVVMYRWLAGSHDPVPPYASHQIGVAGLVVDSWDADVANVLLVNERHKNAVWKFPGGLVDVGEDLDAAVTRELQEEVGVPCRFHGLLGLRHQHRMAWGVSDMYIVSLCSVSPDAARAVDGSVVLAPDGTEVLEARWQPLQEFADTNKHPLNGWAASTALAVLRDGIEGSGHLIGRRSIASATQQATAVQLYAAAASLRT